MNALAPAPRPSRRATLGLFAGALGTLAGALAFRASGPTSPFRLGAQSCVGYAPAYLARRDGHWPESVVSVVELPTDAAIVRAARAGALEAAGMTLDGAFRVQAAGVDVRVIAVLDYSAGGDAIVAAPKSPIATAADLRGKRVAVERHGVGMLFLARVLRTAGMTVGDVVVVNADLPEHKGLVAAGRADAVVTYSPEKERLVGTGGRVVCDSSTIPAAVIDVLVVRADAFHINPAAVRAAAHGWDLAADRLAADPAARAATARAMGITPDEFEIGCRQVRIPTRAESRGLIEPRSPGLAPAAREAAAALNEFKIIDGPIDPDRLFVTPAEMDVIR